MAPRKSDWVPPAEIIPFLEYNSDCKHVRCNLCRQSRKSGVGKWMEIKSLRPHLDCGTHRACWENYLESEQRKQEEQSHLAFAYNTTSAADFPMSSSSPPSAIPSMFPPDEDIEMDVDFAWKERQPLPSNAQLMADLGVGEVADAPTPEETRRIIREEYERLLINAYHDSHLETDGVDEQFVGSDMPKEHPCTDEDEDVDEDEYFCDSEYFPYPNKPAMLLDIIDNLPRCRFTSDQMNIVIHFARQLGVPNIPSLKGLRKIQQKLQSSCGSEPTKVDSPQGNVFYMMDIRETIARDLTNPLVAPHLHLYPEQDTKKPISETFQAERWMEYNPEQLTPMFSKGHKRFWIEELARCADGTFVIPHSWIMRDGVLTSDVSIIKLRADGRWLMDETEAEIVADDLECDYDDLVAEFGEHFEWVDATDVPAMPNPMRKLVDDDEDLYVLMVSRWADDVSGNRSKQYNKHMNMYTGNGCLPGRLLQQEFHVHFVSSSPHASSHEQYAAFRDHIKETETKPVKAYNAATHRKCRFILRVPGLPADNPQQSEEASHMGSNANFPCRKCGWGGTTVEKEQNGKYHECHLAGAARTAQEIRQNLQKQLEFAFRNDAKGIENLQRTTGTKDKITQFWIEQLLSKAL
ncbi:hypothetical protein R3P38DRAFT_3587825 [Favolaschia claudopus]|uniref:Uncharacterized protein n=1 Tax=Favolaschia claudopus TaxID=2862362 RepID=A0AAW0AK19_9AGAR